MLKYTIAEVGIPSWIWPNGCYINSKTNTLVMATGKGLCGERGNCDQRGDDQSGRSIWMVLDFFITLHLALHAVLRHFVITNAFVITYAFCNKGCSIL